MRQGEVEDSHRVIHLRRLIDTSVEKVFSAFRTSKALKSWYDPEACVLQFKPGGGVEADFFPGYRLAAIVKPQLIVQQYTTVVDGIGIWSFAPRAGKTQLFFDHVAEGNRGEEEIARTFYWQGLIENLAAFGEERQLPFVNGEYLSGRLPRKIRHATCQEYVEAHRRRSPLRNR
jgi:uncharacterized protein YndB with AHSA1/START domain